MRNGLNGNKDRILYVAYPLLPVTENSSGGAEQVLWTLARELSRKRYRLTVAACSGSQVAGSLFATGAPANGSLPSARLHEERHAARCLDLLRVREAIGSGFTLVHDHSGSFFAHAPRVNVPVLATLHLPRSFYPADFFKRVAPNVFFNCVSRAQARTFADVPAMVGTVANGIALERFPFQKEKDDYLLWLGRICEEKGTHIALDVAEKAGVPILIAGSVYPFSYHQAYFDREIVPRLQRMGSRARFVESPPFNAKLELMRNARALVVTSTAEETSSLVAMEAAACGTPVLAFRRGALPEVVENGVSGLLVKTADQMCSAVAAVENIQPAVCRERAEENFSSTRMANDYERMYARVLAASRHASISRLMEMGRVAV